MTALLRGGIVVGTEERIADSDGRCTPDGRKSQYQPGSPNFEDDGSGWDKHAWHFWSWHEGGAFFVFADGHVEFVPYTVDPVIFRNLGTHKGGEEEYGTY
jgi:prepilin-type processing-associated H-X9-DG protein